ncbi:M15 family metallopeptidase [Candidatus Peregrinibacteria bacterium]|jgi:peptidoglycan LD-endopeptidase CwlK|nr:M15 family metallopeptidase [Candidatus Peregrinibacteria bacterium]
MPKFGKKSQERLRGVNSELVNVLNELVKIMDVTIIEGVRSQERQDRLVAEGKSKTKFSKHITGRAVDLAGYPIDWEDRDRFHYMGGMLRGIAHQMGVKVIWGGDWDGDGETKDNNFDDLVHIELV